MHNLFAMEAISIAEALGVPSLALSPCLVPQAPPASLERQLKRQHPALYAALTRPGASHPHSTEAVCRRSASKLRVWVDEDAAGSRRPACFPQDCTCVSVGNHTVWKERP